MKLKTLALSAALALPATQALALVDISAFGGYTTVNMSDVNEQINKASSATAISSGYYAGAYVGFTTFPFLKIGPRVELVQPGQGKSGTSTLDTSLVSYELGLSVDTSLPLTGLSVLGGVWGGYGMASGKIANSGTTQTGSGNGFVMNAAAELRYELVAGLAIGLDLGYRLANITNMNNDTNSSYYGSSGQPFVTKTGGSAANFDYSGLNAGGALSFNF